MSYQCCVCGGSLGNSCPSTRIAGEGWAHDRCILKREIETSDVKVLTGIAPAKLKRTADSAVDVAAIEVAKEILASHYAAQPKTLPSLMLGRDIGMALKACLKALHEGDEAAE